MTLSLKEIQNLIEETTPPDELGLMESLATIIFNEATPEFLDQLDCAAVVAIARGGLEFMNRRRTDPFLVRVYNPSVEHEGWTCRHTVLEVNLPDRPFIVDSIRLLLKRRDLELRHLIHPILSVGRDDSGSIRQLFAGHSDPAVAEAYELFLLERLEDGSRLETLRIDAEDVLRSLVLVTDDFDAMRSRAQELSDWLRDASSRAPSPEFPESEGRVRDYSEFLTWLDRGNFIFLGYREYETLVKEQGEFACVKDGSGLGILRDTGLSKYAAPVPVELLPENVRHQMKGPPLLLVAKANSEAPVHRTGLMDYIGVKVFDPKGRFLAEKRFLGLFTSRAHSTSVLEIPILRRKLQTVLELDRAKAGSYDFKQIVNIFSSIPLTELFLLEPRDLYRSVRDIMSIEREKGVRLQIRLDPFQRGFVVMVIMPRDRFNSEVRSRIQSYLFSRLKATNVDYRLAMAGNDEDVVRFHFFFSTGLSYESIDLSELEQDVVALTRTWEDLLEHSLVEAFGLSGADLFRKYHTIFSPGYKVEVDPDDAACDVRNLEALGESPLRVELLVPTRTRFPEKTTHVRLYHFGTLALHEVFPVLENLGLKVLEQISYQLNWKPDQIASVDIFRVQDGEGRPIDIDRDGQRLKDALEQVLLKVCTSDPLNRLVLTAGLTIREVALLQCLRGHLFQLLPTASLTFINRTLLRYPGCVRLILDFFEEKFDPGRESAARKDRMERAKSLALAALDDVSSLPEDEILRFSIDLIDAAVRTNLYLGTDYISIKVESRKLNRIPEPRPLCEIFVSSPHFEAVHLRGGTIARGGLRWSDRPDDFRTEVLGLMKTQMTKNALIVPEGSKGGFVLRHPPSDRKSLDEHVKRQYQTFIRGLLDLTDNLVDGRPEHPKGLVVHDGFDPYLVVAADKGTATFSDIANSVAADYGFWLGDAFASGGSHGYDHKQEGITARGAWECVSRHFRETALKPEENLITVLGIGDMSGDVFGNGMLLSEKILLIAAFNHLHIFLDPDPDAASSFGERKRLFLDPALDWAHYDRSLISEGGGVFDRHAKSISLSPQIRELLEVEEDALSGQELIQKILQLKVDLLWNGGIGTYVKAGSETNADVGDPANDAVRINASQLRARVVGEGGNLGLTQLARIEYALAGGRLNTDAIDNSGGVDMSDHEVNIKILLEPEVQRGHLTFEQRNQLLREMTDEVSRLVLANNYTQALSLSLAEQGGTTGALTLESLQHYLSSTGRLKPEVEFLPNRRTLDQRQRSGKGYTRPELAILLAYCKMDMKRALLKSDLVDEKVLEHHLLHYFPRRLQQRFPDQILKHPLRREIIATRLTNLIADRLGLPFVHGLQEETQVSTGEVLRAILACYEILGLDELFNRVAALEGEVPVSLQYEVLGKLTRSARSIVQWLLLSSVYRQDLATLVDNYHFPLMELIANIDEFLPRANERRSFLARRSHYVKGGFPIELAGDIAASDYWASCMGVADVVRTCSVDLEAAARRFYSVGELFSLGWLRDRLREQEIHSSWEAVSLAGLTIDLRDAQRQLTVLSFQRAPAGRGAWSQSFLKGYEQAAERLMASLGQVKSQRSVDLAAGSVITRLLLQLLKTMSQSTPT